MQNHTWALMRLIVADAGSISADLRAFFLRRLGSNGRLLLLAVLNTTPARTQVGIHISKILYQIVCINKFLKFVNETGEYRKKF